MREAEAAKIAVNLAAVREKLNRAATWNLRDVDPMSNHIAYVFYLRSDGEHKFRNALGDVITERFDSTVLIPADMLLRAPERVSEYVLQQAKDDLRSAKSCV